MNAQAYPDKFSKFLGKDARSGLYFVRLGRTTYAANATCTEIFTVKDGVNTPVSQDVLASKDWILRNMRDVVFAERRKFSEAMQRSNIPVYSRQAYKHRRGYSH